jgi:SWI/SNF-related matrix-associated actin-dependent regulator of chromatin subfamily A member 5
LSFNALSNTDQSQGAVDTPDYTVRTPLPILCTFYSFSEQDSDTNPNTTASSVAGDTQQTDGRKRRAEETQLRKSMFGKKLNKLDESRVRGNTQPF